MDYPTGMPTVFVGRRVELDALVGLTSSAGRARGAAAALVVGPPGSGKTRLLAEVTRRLGDVKSVRLVGYEPIRGVPFGAVADLLRILGTESLPRSGDPAIDDAATDPLRVFEATHRRRVEGGPSVLLVDDLQWVDSLSLGLLHYLLRAAESARRPLTVIATSRPSAVATMFRDGIATVVEAGRRVAIDLGPLGVEEGVELARDLDPGIDAVRASGLWKRSQGWPFWLEALALGRGMVDPPSLIRERLAGLDGDGADLLAAMAVGARPLREAELAAVLGWSEARVRVAADELLLPGLATSAAGMVRLSHDLIREAVLTELPIADIRRIHAAFARWLEADAANDLGQLRLALEHREEAGLETADLAARILASPRRRLLGPDGLRLIASIADRVDPTSPVRLVLDRGLAELATGLGEQEIAIERWSAVSRRASDPLAQRRAELAAATAAHRLGRADIARIHLERARDLTKDERERPGPGAGLRPDTVGIELDALQAEVELWLEHRTADGARSAGRALAAARAAADASGGLEHLAGPEGRAFLAALEAACDAATQESRWDDLLGLSREIERLAGSLDDEALSVEAMTRVGSGLRQIAGSVDAERILRRAWTQARERVLPTAAAEAGHWLARALHDRGRLIEARSISQETAEIEARLGHGSAHWGRADRLVHSLDLSLGDPKAALAALRADAERETNRHHELGIRQTIAEWQGRFNGIAAMADIDAQLDEARRAAAAVKCPRCGHELAIVDAEIQARLGRVVEASAQLAEWQQAETAREGSNTLWRWRAEAALAMARSDHRAAVACARAEVEDAVTNHRAQLELWARIDLGRALESIDRAGAIGAFAEAAALAERMGAVSEGRLIASSLRRLGVRAWRRGPGFRREHPGALPPDALQALSPRELEVARRVESGATNAEIADDLLISPKTVERHLTNLFAKLGTRNRAELAGLVRGSPDDRGRSAP